MPAKSTFSIRFQKVMPSGKPIWTKPKFRPDVQADIGVKSPKPKVPKP